MYMSRFVWHGCGFMEAQMRKRGQTEDMENLIACVLSGVRDV